MDAATRRQNGDEMSTAAIEEEYLTYAKAVQYCHGRGAVNVTEKTLKNYAYEGRRPLKRTKIAGRVYFARTDLEA